jgi:pyruvate/2-oxoglutarate dehydrogenase complex dihydrolipoamide acyltransferase (E2) component
MRTEPSMSTPLTIPRLEMAMTEGVLAEWLVADGAQVKEGDPIYVIETGKATQEIQSPASGRLTQKAAAGETYPVGTDIGEIE